MAARAWWSVGQIAILALWLGASTFFAASVAPALFAALPSRSLAGEVVGRLLPVIFYSGMITGALVIALDIGRAGAWRWGPATISSLVTIVSSAVAQFVITPKIERIRAQIAGPIEALPLDDARRVAFGKLHGISVAWMGLAMLAAVVALVVSARRLSSN